MNLAELSGQPSSWAPDVLGATLAVNLATTAKAPGDRRTSLFGDRADDRENGVSEYPATVEVFPVWSASSRRHPGTVLGAAASQRFSDLHISAFKLSSKTVFLKVRGDDFQKRRKAPGEP